MNFFKKTAKLFKFKFIQKNFASNNILKIWLFSLIFIPLFIFVMKFALSDKTDRFVFTWLILMCTSIFTQFLMNFFKKIKSGNFQHLYILIVLNITMFLTYVLRNHTNWMMKIEDLHPWAGDLLVSIIVSLILFAVKTIVWILLMLKWKQLNNSLEQKKLLEQKHSSLEREHSSLKQKFDELNSEPKNEELEEINDSNESLITKELDINHNNELNDKDLGKTNNKKEETNGGTKEIVIDKKAEIKKDVSLDKGNKSSLEDVPESKKRKKFKWKKKNKKT